MGKSVKKQVFSHFKIKSNVQLLQLPADSFGEESEGIVASSLIRRIILVVGDWGLNDRQLQTSDSWLK